jgi:Dimerisation domain
MNQRHDEDLARAQVALQQMTNGYWATQIIYVAAKLGIADLLSDGPQDVDTLARATQTHAPTLSRLMRLFDGESLGRLVRLRVPRPGELRLPPSPPRQLEVFPSTVTEGSLGFPGPPPIAS